MNAPSFGAAAPLSAQADGLDPQLSNSLLYVFVDNDQPVGNGLGLRRRTGPRYRHEEKPTKRTLNSPVFHDKKVPSILSVFEPCQNQLLCFFPREHTYQFS
jgi:hypothetical protein